MAGAGFDARMIADADRGTKDRLGRAAYIVTGIRNLSARRVRTTIDVDGKRFFKGKACVLLARTSARFSAGSRLSRRRGPMTGALSWGW